VKIRNPKRRVCSAIGLGALLVLPRLAEAAGLQLLPGGNQSVARGGAVAARAEDPMVIANDPAGLAFLSGSQFLLDAIVPIQHMCVDPYGYYGWGAYGGPGSSEFGDQLALDNPRNPTVGATYATTPLPRVCNSAKPAGIPEIAWTTKIGKRFGLGIALVAVPVVVPGLQFGGADGTVETPYGSRPTPTRYSLVKQEVPFAFGPSIGAGYRLLKQLSVGMTFQVLSLKARAIAVQNIAAGTQPTSDSLATLETQDYFIPSLTFSVHAKPIRPLDLVVVFHYTDDFRGAGEVSYETGTFHRGAASGQVPYKNDPISVSDVRVGMPWELTTGARYAGLLSKRNETGAGLGDPMDTELWDVELDLGYSLNGLARNSVNVGHDATLGTQNVGESVKHTTSEGVGAFEVNPHRTTAYTARLGGSFSILPRELAVHAGGFFESRSVDPAYADIDSFAFQRVGLGLGGVIRLGNFDIRLAYSHIFSETLDVVPPRQQKVENATPGDPRSGFDKRVGGTFGPDGTRQGGVVLEDPTAPAKGDAVAAKTQQSAVSTQARPERVVNAGKYTASFDIISVGAVYHF
jgi:hypothetical protein